MKKDLKNRRGHAEIGLYEPARRLAKIDSAEPCTTLQDAQYSADLKFHGFGLPAPIRIVQKHSAGSGFEGELNGFPLSAIKVEDLC
ncbi:MAG: hypothetical protein WCC14_05790 [Acidobacteriaceae bacterium]